MLSFLVNNDIQLKNILDYFFRNRNLGKKYIIKFDEIKEKPTKEQRGFLFGCLFELLSEYFFETEGVYYAPESIRWMFYKKFGWIGVVDGPLGEKILSPKTLSKGMTKSDTCKFITQIIDWIDEETDCIIPPYLRYLWITHLDSKAVDEILSAPFPLRDKFYLRYQRFKTVCLCCGVKSEENDPHHLLGIDKENAGQKPSDVYTIPLCRICHTKIQGKNLERTKGFINTYGYDFKVFCRLMYYNWRYKIY